MMAQGYSKDVKLHFDPADPSNQSNNYPSINDVVTRELKKRSVTDGDLSKMAGNTMTIPIMGILQVAAVNFNMLEKCVLNCPDPRFGLFQM